MLVALASFSLTAAVLVLLPGPDTLVIVRSIVRGGRRRGLATVLGIQAGLFVWIVSAVLGLAALLRASETAYLVLRVVGAVYLLMLGVQSLLARSRIDVPAGLEGPQGAAMGAESGFGAFRAGLLSNLFNPKIGVFFVTFLPAFVPHGAPVTASLLLFGAVFIVLSVAYQLPLVVLATRVSALFARARIRRRLELVTGGVLVAFGLRLAVE